MEVFKLTVTCQKCTAVWKDDVLPETTLGWCKCGALLFKVSRYNGYVYVMSTKSLRGRGGKVGRAEERAAAGTPVEQARPFRRITSLSPTSDRPTR